MRNIHYAHTTEINGTLFSSQFNDIYHSTSGAIEQARQVFIEGNRLAERFQQLVNKRFCLFETGFGAGINFLETVRLWQQVNSDPLAILHYVACERYPLHPDDLKHIYQTLAQQDSFCQQLINQWPLPLSGYHDLFFKEQRVHLTLIYEDIENACQDLVMPIDALYLDGFSPQKNPQMWQEKVFSSLSQHCHSQTTLATWCVAGSLRQALEKVGFKVQRVKGFGSKKHRLIGQYNVIPEAKLTLRQSHYFPHVLRHLKADQPPRRVAVIGAGLAGCLVAHQLTQRHIDVHLFERHADIASEASGNLAGILRPAVTQNDNELAQLTRRGFFLTKQLIEELSEHSDEPIGRFPGVLHLAKDDTEYQKQQSILLENKFPKEFVDHLSAQQIHENWALTTPHGGLFFANAGFVHPRRLCTAALSHTNNHLNLSVKTNIVTFKNHPNQWQLIDELGQTYDGFDAVILTIGSTVMDETASLNLSINRGQISLFSTPHLPHSSPVICQEGYVIPVGQNQALVGATYDHQLDPSPWPASHQENLARLHDLLKRPLSDIRTLGERVGFRSVSKDRLPVVGPLSQPGLYCLLGNASRGIVWSHLGAKIITSMLTGEPYPVGKTLLQRLSPERLLSGQQ